MGGNMGKIKTKNVIEVKKIFNSIPICYPNSSSPRKFYSSPIETLEIGFQF